MVVVVVAVVVVVVAVGEIRGNWVVVEMRGDFMALGVMKWLKRMVFWMIGKIGRWEG